MCNSMPLASPYPAPGHAITGYPRTAQCRDCDADYARNSPISKRCPACQKIAGAKIQAVAYAKLQKRRKAARSLRSPEAALRDRVSLETARDAGRIL